LPPRPTSEQLKKSKFQVNEKINKVPTKSFAQATASAANILKIKEAFPTLPNKKIIEIHNATLDKLAYKTKKIQITTKGPSRKQVIIPIDNQYIALIMNEVSIHVGLINGLLKYIKSNTHSIKSNTHSEFIKLCPSGISIVTTNVPNSSNLSIMEKYFKSLDGLNNSDTITPCLPQSKSYLKVIDIPFIQSNSNKLTHEDIINAIKHTSLFETISFASRPRVIKVSPKSNIAITWLDIWDSQNSSQAKLLINHFFNFGRYIATVRGTNMNPRVLQYHNC